MLFLNHLVGFGASEGSTAALAIFGSPVLTAGENVPYAGFTVSATGGTAPYTFSVHAGTLPTGITLNSSTGAVAGTPTTAGTSSGIIIRVTDNVGATADLASFSIVVSVVDPSFANVVLLCGFNGTDGATTAPDESSSAKTLTFVGNAQIDTAQSKFGGASLLLDGAGDRVTIPDSPDWDLSDANSDQYTIEGWVRFNSSVTTGTETIVSHFATSGNLSWEFQRLGAQISLITDSSGSGAQTTITTTSAGLVLSTWHHLAVDKDATGKVRIYVGGVMKGSATPANSNMFNATTVLAIGSTGGGIRPLNGWIDELRITKGVARYASDGGFTAPTAAYPRS
ncbi:MAG: LamG domain-containing protein [Mesorhizobium sp.]|nr:MAG: LamG domain-containing protein [Mesorhizobium sp.]RWN73201.1 MAG: LamG domain-containing protein [Mesorhizobium sp.]RWN85145.1 MAG: LamG domain-containing protein [Mesorhizobium sp.]RWO58152.1 MAG: LamG domain-containing protein [Mesorhizobium sp.]